MMTCGTLKYRNEEGDVTLNADFLAMPSTIQIDVLSDWIHDLQRIRAGTLKRDRENYRAAQEAISAKKD